jgi:hypothetical protein
VGRASTAAAALTTPRLPAVDVMHLRHDINEQVR